MEDLEEGESLTEQEIWDRMYLFSQDDWDVAKTELKSFFSSGTWILTGTVGRWDGCHAAGTVFQGEDFSSIMGKALTDCDYFKLYDVNGHGSLTVEYQKKVLTGRIKPAFFMSNFLFL